MADLAEIVRLLQEALARTSVCRLSLGTIVLPPRPRPKNKQPKSSHYFVVEEKNKRAKNISPKSSAKVLIISSLPGSVIT